MQECYVTVKWLRWRQQQSRTSGQPVSYEYEKQYFSLIFFHAKLKQ